MTRGYDANGNFLPPQQLVDEIDRLQGEVSERKVYWSSDEMIDAARRAERIATIERCAQVVTDFETNETRIFVREIAAAIRALKQGEVK